MPRITRKKLEEKCAVLSRVSGNPFELNYAACYGGYCLESNGGKFRHSPRISAKEMWWFMAGMIETQWLRDRGIWQEGQEE